MVSRKSGHARLDTDGEWLVRQHLWLAPQILRQVDHQLPGQIDRDDLAGAGLLALVEAALVFEPERGFSFPAFAAKRVRGAMLDELRRSDWAPRSVRRWRRRTEEIVDRLRMQLAREPSAAEIATALGVSAAQLRRSEADSARAVVAGLPESSVGGTDEPAAEAAAPEEELLKRERDVCLHRAVNELPARERHAIAGYYLLRRPMRELATELGVTESRVSQLCRNGLAQLRRELTPYVADHEPDGVHSTGIRSRRRRRHRPETKTWSPHGRAHAWPMAG